MTQAINLANFANNLDTSGGVNPSAINAPVPVSKGGTAGTTAASARSNLDVAQAVYSVPSGGIIMWSGSIASIPGGWFLCNGGNGTPNLLDRFVIAAGSGYGVGSVGGTADSIVVSHTHGISSSVNDPGHAHYVGSRDSTAGDGGNYAQEFVSNAGSGYGPNTTTNSTGTGITVSTSISATGSSGVNANLPPYYALAYIMKS